MILADTLKLLTTMGPTALKQVLDHSGYRGCSFKTAEFLGMTNGGQFCYKVIYLDKDGEDETGKVFVTYDIVKQTITADF